MKIGHKESVMDRRKDGSSPEIKESENLGGGYSLESKGFIKTEGFEKVVVLLMTACSELWKLMESKKSFRMELFYDAKTLNTDYRFFTPDEKESEACSNQECKSDLYQNLHL